MKQIWKFQLDGADKLVKAPVEKWLDVKVQGDSICVWAIVNHDIPEENYYLYALGTGWPVEKIVGDYIGTVLDGAYVWHVFAAQVSRSAKERIESKKEMQRSSEYAS